MEDKDKLVTVRKGDLINLVMDSLKLNALENGGVDNWCNYSEAICDEDNFGGVSYSDISDLTTDEFYDDWVSCYVK